uniref:Ell-associated factor Eaf n=1 Tax=Anopheles christyi TaxID=43041 RepID=A0A182KCS7_9DIPT
MDNRLNIGSEVRELKLGSTFTNAGPSNQFHTIKYDFKPASVDVNKPAVLEISANKQVTVTVPHLDGSGVPNTVFKGNQRDYSRKDCVLILNRATGEITLEQLNSSIVVKKTRIESKAPNPPPTLPTIKVENNTARQSSKTKITTGVRKNAPISFMPKHSPLQGSPSYPHRSPQSAPAWNANNTQQTLPSIPMIGLDDGLDFGTVAPPSSSSSSSSSSANASSGASMNNHLNNNIGSGGGGSNSNSNHSSNNHHHHQQQQQQQHHHSNNSSSSSSSNVGNSNSLTGTANNHSGSNSGYLNHGSAQNNNNHHGNSGSSGSNHHHHSNHLSVPSSYGGASGGGGRNHLHSEPSMPHSVEVSLPPDRELLPPPVALTGIGVGATSDPEMMTSSESDGSDDSDSSSSDQESDSSTEDNNDSPVKESIFDPRPDPTVAVTAAAVDLSKDLCLSSNSDSDD